MREEIPFDNRPKASKFSDQNQFPPRNGSTGNGKGANGNLSKPKSSWGSHIVKGFSGEKKTKTQSSSSSQGKKLPLTSSNASNQKNSFGASHSRVKRALISDLSCSINAIQVHPHIVHQGTSKDLFLEIDQLRRLLQESKEREFKLQAESSECKRSSKVNDLERELELKKSEVDELVKKVELLESEKTSLSQQLSSLNWFPDEQQQEGLLKREEVRENLNGLEMEVVELRRLNKELQLQKRNLICKLSSMETQLNSVEPVLETDVLEKIKAEASKLRHANEDLCKQVEGLQMNRLNEVEELVYLRWVNSCLRNELRNISNMSSDGISSPCAPQTPREPICLSSCRSDNDSGCNCMVRLNLTRKLKKWPINDEDLQQFKCQETFGNHSWDSSQNSIRRHSISGSKCCSEDIFLNKRRQSDGFIWSKDEEKVIQPLNPQNGNLQDVGKPQFSSSFQEASKLRVSFDVKKRALRIPNPPPRPSCTASSIQKEQSSQFPLRPPPPPPPPPKFMARNIMGTVQRAPQVVEFYHSLMKRDTRKDSSGAGICDTTDVANVRSSMIGEIENRSSYLLAIKADVETQGEFVNSLIQEVTNAVYQDIEDVVAFVKWLDDELCFLVDERAVLKHFEWPEKKADTLREAAFGYRDLKKLEHEVTNYKDDPQLSCDAALKKITALSEKMERSVYNLLAMRDLLMRRCKEFQIPTEWMFDTGIISKIKFGSVKLAKIYMKRVAMELQFKGTSDKDSSMDYMLLQGVRFAFRIHQFAGGFDAETMRAFEELRNLALVLNKS